VKRRLSLTPCHDQSDVEGEHDGAEDDDEKAKDAGLTRRQVYITQLTRIIPLGRQQIYVYKRRNWHDSHWGKRGG
jgi:hypothetical protein